MLTKKATIGVSESNHDRSESAIAMIEGHASDKIVIVENKDMLVESQNEQSKTAMLRDDDFGSDSDSDFDYVLRRAKD